MSLPEIPTGYAFDIQVIEGARISVAIVSTVDGSNQLNGFIDAVGIPDSTEFTAAVEAKANELAAVFNQSLNLQSWVEQIYPAPVINPPADPVT